MDQSYWLRQTDQPLFPELEWSRPEHKAQAGKLLIIGGNKFGFVEPAEAFRAAEASGIGTVRLLLPDSLRPFVGKAFANGNLAPSTPSGSFSRAALADFIDASAWADGVLVAGGIGRNSETTTLIENFLDKYEGRVTVTKDAADVLCEQPIGVLHRPETLLVLAMGQLRRLGSEAHFPRAFTTEMGLVQLVENLHEFTKRFPLSILVRHQDQYVVAVGGQVSTTKLQNKEPVWRVATAARASVWWLQNPTKSFEALTSSCFTNR